MKKMVIFGYTMDMGGAERALLNIINVVSNDFDIDLILIKDTGVLMKEIPNNINVRKIRKNIFSYILFRYIPLYRKFIINKLTKDKYDVAVAFMEGRAATWLVDMKQECKKIGWIHNDVNEFNIGISDKEINDTYSKLDKVIIVSEHSRKSFCEKYNVDSKNVEVIYNIIDEDNIIKKAEQEQIKKNKFTFINVAKMRPQKNHFRLLNSVKTLKDEGYDFELWLVGNGPLEDKIKNRISDLKLGDTVKMFGLKENPFPYVKAADYFVMSSDHEGYPLSLLESLLLKTPVISTDVSGAREILDTDKYGIVCDITEDSLINSMRDVLENKYKNKFEDNLKNYKGANQEIIKKLKDLFMK